MTNMETLRGGRSSGTDAVAGVRTPGTEAPLTGFVAFAEVRS
jgi:hypothetical protein